MIIAIYLSPEKDFLSGLIASNDIDAQGLDSWAVNSQKDVFTCGTQVYMWLLSA